MCGIAGIVQLGRIDYDTEDVIKRMTQSMTHRGPNDDGVDFIRLADNNLTIALGHRRLSIIDLSNFGHQPMWDRNKDICLILNGEIYSSASFMSMNIQTGTGPADKN